MAADPKAAPLADDLKELALSLPTSVFPKAFFCALCSELAIDSYKLLCCNKAICTTCQSKLSFPTTCPSCDHSPLEADSCAPNKALRNTMRVWLQKQKKKEEAKVTAQTATPAPEAKSPATGGPVLAEGADKPLDSVEVAATAGDASFESAAAPTDAEDGKLRTVSASAQPKEGSAALDGHDAERRAGSVSQTATQSVEPPAVNASSNENNKMDDDTNTTGNNPMMNGMQNQMGFGFQGQGFGGMGFNGMPNMMGNTWNNMNPMDFNMNNMYNNSFGGNMGMAMGDMSAMNMMNYGGGYGNGWNGMGGGYGNFNGFNQMGGYNQSGGYPEMMNQFPKSNFPNQNQNHLPASQGGALPQQNNRAGSHAGSVSGTGGASSRPESRSGPAQNVRRSHKSLPGQPSLALRNIKPSADNVTPQQREGESPNASADATADSKPEDGQDPVVRSTEEGKDKDDDARESAATANTTADSEVNAEVSTITGNQDQSSGQTNGLNQIQTVGSEDADMQAYGQSMMSNGIVPNMGFANGMMNQFPNQMQMNAPFNPGMNMGFHQNNSFGPRGGFNAAYGAATVLTGEPQGRGVEGAPTGPRAMREGRPNTGFSSRMNNTRYQPPPPPKSMTPAQSVGARSPQRRVRSRSPQRDETLRTRDKSVTRSRSRSQPRDDEKGGRRERSRSADGESRREGRGRSVTPQGDTDLEHRNDDRHYRSRDVDREDEYDDRARDDRGSRGDRTRSVSADSKYRSSRRDKEKYRSSRAHRERSKDRRRHRSRSPVEKSRYDDASYANGDRESESSSRRRHRSDKDKHRDRSRDRSRDKDRERDRRDRREKEKDHDYERDKDRSRNKDKERRRRRDREAEVDDRDYDDDRYRSSRRSHKDRDRDERDRDDHSRDDRRESDRDAKTTHAAEDDIVGKMMQKRAISPPLNAPTGPSANTFSIKGAGRTKSSVMPPPQPPTGPRGFQPPKGPAADRDKERHRRKSSASSVVSTPATPSEATSQDHYAAERERNARERNSRDRVDRDQRDVLSKSLHSRIHSASRSSVSAKRSRDEDAEVDEAPRESTRSEIKVPTGPASHRDKRRKSGAGGDNSIANLFTAGLRKNAGKTRRGGVRTEGDVEREMERVERERDRR